MTPDLSRVPRRDRDLVRGRLAAERLQAAGRAAGSDVRVTAMDAALEHVRIAFDRSSIHNGIKWHVETMLRMDPTRLRERLRPRALAFAGADIDTVLAAMDGDYRRERQAQQRLALAGQPSRGGARYHLRTLYEFRLALRWIRRHRRADFAEIVRAITGDELCQAAAE